MSAELFHVIAAVVRRHTATGGSIRVVRRWDPHERVWSAPMPFLFQRPMISAGAMSFQSVREAITRQCEQTATTNPAFTGVRFTRRRHAQMLIAGVLSTWSCEQRFEGPIARALSLASARR
jgi:hypothetical protein